MVWAVVPLKEFTNAKQRLAGVLSENERSQFFHAMVEDVLDVLASHPDIEQTLIVSDDPKAEILASRYNTLNWSEKSLAASGLNGVIDAVADQLTAQGITDMLVVHGDLPLLRAEEVHQLIIQHKYSTVPSITIAPDTRNDGSNCVIASPPNAIAFQYGAGSFNKHLNKASQQGVTSSFLTLSGASKDIDNQTDLIALAGVCDSSKHSLRYLHHSGIAKRLATLSTNHSTKDPMKNYSTTTLTELENTLLAGQLPSNEQALLLADHPASDELTTAKLMSIAGQIRDQGFQNMVTYSRKVFIPLTHLCRDVCHYCTFAQTPKNIESPYMSVEDVLASVRSAVKQGCKEALFTLGEKPELRYSTARKALKEMGFESTLDYVAHVAGRVFSETGILPHINAGCMTEQEIALLRPVSASMGIMLESTSERLTEKGMPHYGSPDKVPAVRLKTIETAGQANVPFTSGILIGIGETRRERIESLLALRDMHARFGHIQEIIIQNFRAKPNTNMAQSPEPDLNELLWTIAVARIIFGPSMSIQAPPNLSPGVLPKLVNAGINDWGGVSPITPDYVNPEAPWPHLDKLKRETVLAGKYLHERLTIYPNYAINGNKWLDKNLQTTVLRMIDAQGLPRVDDWCPGDDTSPPEDILNQLKATDLKHVSADIKSLVTKTREGLELSEAEVVRLFQAHGDDLTYICQQANKLRQQCNGETVSYVVNRNINYTNICYFKCQFCAFSKGKLSENLRGRPYDLSQEEIARRCTEAWNRGATEVCMQGGIHPDYTGDKYLEVLNTIKAATPSMHIHAFSPLEVWQGAATLGLSLKEFLQQLKTAGLNTLPGTAAEILDDEVRAVLCPDKINTSQWFEVMETAHGLGFKTTATIMYGHIEGHKNWARHLLSIRHLQQKTGGFTEFVPLPFVHMEAPLYLKGKARTGPTFREALLMHAIARLVLSPLINNIQTSWVKMGGLGIEACLNAGVNDLGGTLMNESITRSAGAKHGQEFSVEQMQQIITRNNRVPRQRSTIYGEVPKERIDAVLNARELVDVINTAPIKSEVAIARIVN